MTEAEIAPLAAELGTQWSVIDDHHLRREYSFPDFASALAFTNRVGALAEEQGHHPDLELGWGRVVVTIWTHKIDGLTRSDFVLAAHISDLA
jgi:4a-hydroxytetrahydrobiopterin dehydratase